MIHRHRRLWGGILKTLALISMGGRLLLPAQAAQGSCILEEHTHSPPCYAELEEVVQILQCSFSFHVHSDSCRDANGDLHCGISGSVIHDHDSYCVTSDGTLVCPIPAVPAHTHGDTCRNTDGQLTCPLEALLPHTHSEDCYDEEGNLLCALPVVLQHDHDHTCIADTVQTIRTDTLICGKEAHIHGEGCVTLLAESSDPAGPREDDLPTVSGQGIRFGLFNYDLSINKTADGSAWRPISRYFTFRNSSLTTGETPSSTIHIPSWNINPGYDADGFTANHATVEWMMRNGLPVLSLTRNPDPEGSDREDPGLDADTRSLAYLFSSGDHAVTAYSPGNTILQKSGNRYFYDSRSNAVDFDMQANRFRLRSYPERNSTTAGNPTADGIVYGDFLPFSYTEGKVVGNADGVDYHIPSTDTDYWFGMTMEVDFFQTKDGQLDGQDMIFSFSGDDDVWVFVDDVLVLDLGGTHGTASGSINFATGAVTQYLSWNGGTPDSETTSFPTTIRACFDSAGAAPNGGWNKDGSSLADYTEHTLKFFYLERGAAVANCLLDFRLPTLPDKSLTVTKNLLPAEDSGVTEFIEDTLTYRFRVVKADKNGQPTEDLFLPAGTGYTLLSGGTTSGSGTIGEDGCFSLKAGQSAQFTDMLVKGNGAVSYIVQELLPDDLTGQYAGVEYEVSGAAGQTEAETGEISEFTAYNTGPLTAEQTQTVTFRNKVDTSRLGTLKITKKAAHSTEFPEGQVFPIQVTLGGQLLPVGSSYRIEGETAERTVTTEGILDLSIGQTAVLSKGILSGTKYEVTELGEDYTPTYSGGDTCTQEGASGEVSLGETVHITVTNYGSYRMPTTGGPGYSRIPGIFLTLLSLLEIKRRAGRNNHKRT